MLTLNQKIKNRLSRLLLCVTAALLLNVYGASAQTLQWQQIIGPFVGTIGCFAVRGTTLFLGANNGIFRSTDNGATWTAINTGLTNKYVESLALNDVALFAGTGGGGVFRSTDNGTSWTAINTGLANKTVWSLAVSGTTIFAGTNAGIFRSIDNGANWTGSSLGLLYQDVYSLAASGTTIFAGTSGGGILSSIDNGTNWTEIGLQLTEATVFSLVIHGGTLFAGTTGGGVFRTADGGATWTAMNMGLTNPIVYSLTVSGTNLFAGASSGWVFRAPLTSTSVKEQSEPSLHFTPFPNPFSDQTTLEYDLTESQHVRIAIFSPLGQLLFTLADEWQQAGRHSLPLDMNGFASGAYIARLQAGTTTQISLLRLVR